MSKSGAEKIQFILNNHEQAYRRLKPVYTFLELASWISVVLLIIYLSGKNHVLTAAFLCFAWTAFWVLFLFALFPKSFLYSRSSESAQPHGGHQRLTRCKAGAA